MRPSIAADGKAASARRNCRAGKALPAVAVLLLFAMPLAAQVDETFARATVPVVANVGGPGGIRWRTDVALRNDSGADAEVILTLPTAPGEPFLLTTLPAGQTLVLPDLVRQTFGLAEVMSPLLVHTLGPRSITVGASVYPVKDEEIGSAEIVPVFYRDPPGGTSIISGLRVSEAYRTNVGLVNLTDAPAAFTLALQRLEGRNLAVQNVTLAPRSMIQGSMQTFFPLIRESEDTFSVIIETAADNCYGYASVIANGDNDAIFVQPLMVRY